MSNTKISALTSATTPLAGTETLPIVQSSTTKQVSVANLTAGRDVTGLSFTGGNVKISGNTIVTTDTNGNLTLDPNGSGYTIIVSATNGTIAQWGDTTSRTFYVKSANVGGFANDTLINESDSGVGQFQWKNSGATLWTMNYTGNLTPAGAAKGINFTANTPAAGMTSQLLNWYEEGTCTLTLTTDATPPTVAQTATARYTRIGRTVTLQCNFANKDTTGATGYVAVTGAPFTAGLSTQGVCTFYNLGAVPAVVQIGAGSTTLNMYGIATQTAILMLAGTGRYLYFNITYTI